METDESRGNETIAMVLSGYRCDSGIDVSVYFTLFRPLSRHWIISTH
jgi:hypothetical protein